MRRLLAVPAVVLFFLIPPAGAWADTTTGADVQVGVSAVSDRVEVGSYAYFDVGVVNNGPGDATGVSVSDQLPAGMVFVASMSDPACTASGQTVTCAIGSVGNHAVTDPYRIAAQATQSGTFTDTATVTADQPDPNPGNNSASVAVTVFGPADLAVGMSGPQQVDVRTTNAFTIVVTNGGPDTTGATSLDVSLAPQMSTAAWTASQGSCLANNSTSPASLHCDLGSLAAGATAHVVLQTYAYVEGSGTTQATVTSDRPDPDTSNNSASVTTTVVPVADIQVAGGPYVAATKAHRSTVTFTISVYNGGPSTATSVTLKDRWTGTMNQLDLISISTDQGTCAKTGGTSAACAIGTLAPGGDVTVTVVLTAQGSGTVTDTATAAAAEKDPDTSNNAAVFTTSV